jgi:hypothetical protein
MGAVVIAGRREQVGAFPASTRVAKLAGGTDGGSRNVPQLLCGCKRRAAGLRCRERGRQGPSRLEKRQQPGFLYGGGADARAGLGGSSCPVYGHL